MNMEDPIKTALENAVNVGDLAGLVTLVWHDSKVIQTANVGWRDQEAKLPMERNTLFRIASMTKPITSMAALMLCEEGRFALDEPITHWAPEFSQMRVLRSPTGSLDQTDPADRPITFEDLLTHRSGLTYGSLHTGPLATAFDVALGSDIDSELSPDEWIARLAALPLIDQPGAGFHYGHSTDLLGFLIARIAGIPFGTVLKQRIFEPLGMQDTGFIVPPEKRARRATMYGFTDTGHLTPRPRGVLASGQAATLLNERPNDLAYVSGGQGLWSTADDYLTFARMFLGDGAVDGVRLLRPETLALMMTNRLTASQRARATLLGFPVFPAHGFGMGVAVVLDPEKAAPIHCRGGIGTVGWPGAFGGWWQADPTNGSAMILLAQNMIEVHQFAQGIGLGIYSTITEFHKLASAALH
ncbi:MAG: beta-lactamase family protein [Chloroflexota bacterium]|nr:beta-lactamase family protein [Chloroflexota bacterium]